MSEDLTMDELILMTSHKMAWKQYTSLKELGYQQAQDKKYKK